MSRLDCFLPWLVLLAGRSPMCYAISGSRITLITLEQVITLVTCSLLLDTAVLYNTRGSCIRHTDIQLVPRLAYIYEYQE